MNRFLPSLRFLNMLVQIAALASVGTLVTFALAIIGFGLLISVGPRPLVFVVEPSPDRTISLVTERDLGGGATNPAAMDVYLVGGDFTPQATLGGYFHGGPEPGDGWRGDREVNVCMLRYPFEERADAADAFATITTTLGRAATVRVTKNCPAQILKDWSWPWG